MGYDENNISGKFIIGLCKRKETAALKIKTATSKYKLSVKMGLPSSGFFLFCRWADVFSLDT